MKYNNHSSLWDQRENETILFFPAGKKNKYLPAEDYFQKGLYMLDIGQNDLASAFYSKTLDQIIASISTILAEFETGLQVRFNGFFLNFGKW